MIRLTRWVRWLNLNKKVSDKPGTVQGVELIELAKDVTLEQIQAATGVEFYKTLVA